jgi:hypothetical protein
VVRRAALVLAACMVLPATASADPSLLARAQAALDDLRYEDAADFADRAWRAGGNHAGDLIAIFRLAGQVAVTMGNGELAESHFVRLLALDPDARLPDGISPKIAARFAAARARTGGRLRASLRADGTTVSAEVTSDPAKMVSSLRARYGKDAVQEAIAPDPLSIALKVERPTEVEVQLLDEFGNILVEDRLLVEPAAVPRAGAPAARTQAAVGQSLAERNAAAADGPVAARSEFDEDDEPVPVGPPLYTRWGVWAGAAGAMGAIGIVFGLKARSDQSQLDELNDESGAHDFRDASAVEDALRRDALIADVCFVLAAGAGTAALLLWMREKRSQRAPVVAPTGSGAAVRFDF